MFLKYVYVFFISMVPVIELRGAIPVGIGLGLPVIPTYVVAVIGNMIPVPFIYFFLQKLLKFGMSLRWQPVSRFCTWIYQKGVNGGKKLQGKSGIAIFWALLIFIGIPLPGTGAWTGTLAASILNIDFKKSVLAAMGGVLLAGIIMGAASMGVFSMIFR